MASSFCTLRNSRSSKRRLKKKRCTDELFLHVLKSDTTTNPRRSQDEGWILDFSRINSPARAYGKTRGLVWNPYTSLCVVCASVFRDISFALLIFLMKFTPKVFLSSKADGWLPFSADPCEERMKNHSNSSRLNNQTPNHTKERNCKKTDGISVVWPRFSLRDYAFCMATLFLFCLGSLFYQLNGGPPKVLVDIRQYLGKACAFSPLELPSPSREDVVSTVDISRRRQKAAPQTCRDWFSATGS